MTTWDSVHLFSGHIGQSCPNPTLLRTEAIGLNDFLHRVGVPNVEARCPCGWERQTPKHVVMSFPGLAGRDRMLSAAGTMDYTTLLNTEKGLRVATS